VRALPVVFRKGALAYSSRCSMDERNKPMQDDTVLRIY
jgi:hypothetical protein